MKIQTQRLLSTGSSFCEGLKRLRWRPTIHLDEESAFVSVTWVPGCATTLLQKALGVGKYLSVYVM